MKITVNMLMAIKLGALSDVRPTWNLELDLTISWLNELISYKNSRVDVDLM